MAVFSPALQASMRSARQQTRRAASFRGSISAKATAASSPREKPATASGRTPFSTRALAQARSMAKRQGCVFRVRESVSLSPAKHCSRVPGRSASTASKM